MFNMHKTGGLNLIHRFLDWKLGRRRGMRLYWTIIAFLSNIYSFSEWVLIPEMHRAFSCFTILRKLGGSWEQGYTQTRRRNGVNKWCWSLINVVWDHKLVCVIEKCINIPFEQFSPPHVSNKNFTDCPQILQYIRSGPYHQTLTTVVWLLLSRCNLDA